MGYNILILVLFVVAATLIAVGIRCFIAVHRTRRRYHQVIEASHSAITSFFSSIHPEYIEATKYARANELLFLKNIALNKNLLISSHTEDVESKCMAYLFLKEQKQKQIFFSFDIKSFETEPSDRLYLSIVSAIFLFDSTIELTRLIIKKIGISIPNDTLFVRFENWIYDLFGIIKLKLFGSSVSFKKDEDKEYILNLFQQECKSRPIGLIFERIDSIEKSNDSEKIFNTIASFINHTDCIVCTSSSRSTNLDKFVYTELLAKYILPPPNYAGHLYRLFLEIENIPYFIACGLDNKCTFFSKDMRSKLNFISNSVYSLDSYLMTDSKSVLRNAAHKLSPEYCESKKRLQDNANLYNECQKHLFDNKLNFLTKAQINALGLFCLFPFSLSSDMFRYCCDKLGISSDQIEHLIINEFIYQTSQHDYFNLSIEVALLTLKTGLSVDEILNLNMTTVNDEAYLFEGMIHRFHKTNSYGYYMTQLVKNVLIKNCSEIDYISLLNIGQQYYDTLNLSQTKYEDQIEKLFVMFTAGNISMEELERKYTNINPINNLRSDFYCFDYYYKNESERYILKVSNQLVEGNLYQILARIYLLNVSFELQDATPITIMGKCE